MFPRPVARCEDPEFVPLCGLTYEGILTGIEEGSIGPAPHETRVIRLLFDNSAQVFELTERGNVNLPVEVGGEYRVDVRLVRTAVIGYGSFEIRDSEGLVSSRPRR